MGIDANDIHFFLHQVASLFANSCLTFARQYPLVFFASLCLLFIDLFFPHVFVFVFHSFPILVTVVVSVILLLNGGRTTTICEPEKTTSNHENSVSRGNANYDTTIDNDYKNLFDKSTSVEDNNDDKNTKEIREVNVGETFSCSIYERPTTLSRHDMGSSKEFNNETGTKQRAHHSDKMDLKNLLLAEMERNRRLESLTAKRRARKLLSMQVRNTLLNMGKNNSPSPLNIGSIQIPKGNPLLSHDPAFVSPTPGSAPSVLLPGHNPFRVPYDTNQEQTNHFDNKRQNPVFRRGDSFSHGSFFPSPTDYDRHRHLNSSFYKETSPCMPLMNEAENEMPLKVEVEDKSRETSPNSIDKRDIEMGRGNHESTWVASSHLNNIEENESRSREVHDVSNQDIIDVGFSKILSHKNDDIVGLQDLMSIKSDKEEDRDGQHAMYDVSEDEDNIQMKLSKNIPMDQQHSSDEEASDDLFMESFRKLTTPKASQNTTILKERLVNRVSPNVDILDHNPEEHGRNECVTTTSHFLEPEIDQRILLPSPKSVLQPNLLPLSTSNNLDHEVINVQVLLPQERREFDENTNGMDTPISIKIEQDSSIPNQEIPTKETNVGSNINGHAIGNSNSGNTADTMGEPYVLVEPSDSNATTKDVETADPINPIEDDEEKSTKNTQNMASEDPSHSPDQLRIEIT